MLSEHGELLIESMIGGRPIATYRLAGTYFITENTFYLKSTHSMATYLLGDPG
jgi:hypothetical protein